jgi:hypothetical protein
MPTAVGLFASTEPANRIATGSIRVIARWQEARLEVPDRQAAGPAPGEDRPDRPAVAITE